MTAHNRFSAESRYARKLDWQETFTDRGDGSKDLTGWEAETYFGTWYSVEQYFGSDSYAWHVKHDFDVVADCDDPDQAKEAAQADFEKRVRAGLCTGDDAQSSQVRKDALAVATYIEELTAPRMIDLLLDRNDREIIIAALKSYAAQPPAAPVETLSKADTEELLNTIHTQADMIQKLATMIEDRTKLTAPVDGVQLQAQIQQAIMAHPFFDGSAALAFGLAGAAMKALPRSSAGTGQRSRPRRSVTAPLLWEEPPSD